MTLKPHEDIILSLQELAVLKRLTKNRFGTQQAFAHDLGVHSSTISRIFNGNLNLTYVLAQQVYTSLGRVAELNFLEERFLPDQTLTSQAGFERSWLNLYKGHLAELQKVYTTANNDKKVAIINDLERMVEKYC